jgi:lysophospholipase L1-like esterase
MRSKLLLLLTAIALPAFAQQTINGKVIQDQTTPLTKLVPQSGQTLLCNSTGGTAPPTACTASQAKSVLSITSGDVSGLAPVATSGSASDLGTGMLPAARLPAPTGSTLGGVKSAAPVANQYVTGINGSGVITTAQPATSQVANDSTVPGSTTQAALGDLDLQNEAVTQAVLLKLQRGQDVTFGQLSDSTGDTQLYLTDNTQPLTYLRQFAVLLGPQWPAYTVAYSQWLDPTTSAPAATAAPYTWYAPTILQTGPSGLSTHNVSGATTSNVITDSSIASGDAGKHVLGLGIPPHAFVGVVTAGTSFTLLNEEGNAIYPTQTLGPTACGGSQCTVQLGADPVIHFWSVAISGSRSLYGFGQYRDPSLGVIRPDLWFFNHSHNEIQTNIGSNGQNNFFTDVLRSVEQLTAVHQAPVIMMGQNPRFDSTSLQADEPIKTRIVSQIAAQRGYGYVDVWSVFNANPSWQSQWMSNNLHPNTTGYGVWAGLVNRLFQPKSFGRMAPPSVPKSLFQTAAQEQLVADGLLLDWNADGTLPIPGLTATNITYSKDTTDFPGVTALKLVATSSNNTLDIPLAVSGPNSVAGQWVTAQILCRYDVGTDPTENCALGLHYIDANNGAVKVNSTAPSIAYNNGKRDGQGNWFWHSVTLYFPPGVKFADLFLYGDELGSSTATYIQKIIVQRGRTLSGSLSPPQPIVPVTGFLQDYMVNNSAGVNPAKVAGLGTYLNTVIGANFPGTAGNYFSTPSASANRITGNIELRALLRAGYITRPTGQANLIGKSGGSALCYRFFVNGSGALQFATSTNGTTEVSGSSGASLLPSPLTSDLWVRAQLTASTGAVTLWTAPVNSDDSAGTWTQLGGTTILGSLTIFDSATQVVEAGSGYQGTALNSTGPIGRAEIATTLGGSAVVQWLLPSAGARSWTAGTGEVWTAFGTVPTQFGPGKSMVLPPVTTSSIGGSALTAGQCTSGTVSVPGATTSMAVAVSGAAANDPGDNFVTRGFVSAPGTVTFKVCAITAGTPANQAYVVWVAGR